MTDIRPAFNDEDLAELRVDGSLNMVGIKIPNVGKISDREKKELRALSEELAKRNKDFAGVLYDYAQLEKKRPQAAAKIRELCGAGAEDLVVPVVGIASEGKTRTAANQKAQFTSGGEARLELTSHATSNSPGSPTSPCSSMTTRRTAGTRRTIHLPLRMSRTWRSCCPIRALSGLWPMTWF
jgi:hypothetical protein